MDIQEYLSAVNAGAHIPAGSPLHAYMHAASQEALRLTAELNGSYHTPEEVRALFSQITGKPVTEDFCLFPPFYTEFGKNITVGRGVFINMGCTFQDHGGIWIDDGALIGHNVVLATLGHDLSPKTRHGMTPRPIRIGRKAWIGAGAILLPGVTIGDGAIVAAGAAVTRDVPENTVAGGVPARILKTCEEEQHNG